MIEITGLSKSYGDVPAVRGNESRLGQVFVNLMINAIQSIDEGDVANNEIRITTRMTDDGRVRIEISDTGQGIPEDLIQPLLLSHALYGSGPWNDHRFDVVVHVFPAQHTGRHPKVFDSRVRA